ncbi:acyltransferase, partial [Stenotrophomonas maltophilia]
MLSWLSICTLSLGGWKVSGTLPDLQRLVFIIAPHSSNCDGLWGMAAKISLVKKVKVLGTPSLFSRPLVPL